jgi:hypothetical protein
MDDWYRRRRDGHIYPEFIAGVLRFFNFAFSIDENVSGGKIKCPCVRCKNQKFFMEEDVYKQPRTFIDNKSKQVVVSTFFYVI